MTTANTLTRAEVARGCNIRNLIMLTPLLLTTGCGTSESGTQQATLAHLVCDGVTWTSVSNKAIRPLQALSCAAADGVVYVAALREGQVSLMIHDGGAWLHGEPVQLPRGTTPRDVAVAWGQALLHLTVLDTSNHLWHATYEGGSWSQFHRVASRPAQLGTIKSIATASQGKFMHLVCLDMDKRLHHTLHDGMRWSPSEEIVSPPGLVDIACAADHGMLHLVALYDSGGFWHCIRDGHWAPGTQVAPPGDAWKATALDAGFVEDTLYVVGRSPESTLQFMTWQGGAWSAANEVTLRGEVSRYSVSSIIDSTGDGRLLLCAETTRQE